MNPESHARAKQLIAQERVETVERPAQAPF